MTTIHQTDRDAAEKFDRDLSVRLTGTQLHNLAGVLSAHLEAERARIAAAARAQWPDIIAVQLFAAAIERGEI